MIFTIVPSPGSEAINPDSAIEKNHYFYALNPNA
jgi:hypothetical protein